MIRDTLRRFGCGFNKTRYAAQMKVCAEHGLDYDINRMGPGRIKSMIKRKYGIELDIKAKTIIEIAREAQEIVYE
jgi:hypothetical protein